MAATTLRAVLTEVPIVLAMAGNALLRHLVRARWHAMAVRALKLAVRTQQSEVRLLAMIELPQRPAIARMAALAFLAQAILVHVILGVTVDTPALGIGECQRPVALCAAHHPMQTNQRETGQIVIEQHACTEGGLAVAVLAAPLELAAMRVLAAMAARAVLGKFLRGHRRRMTGIATDPCMRPFQRVLVLA